MPWLFLFLNEILAFGQCELLCDKSHNMNYRPLADMKYSPHSGECDSYLPPCIIRCVHVVILSKAEGAPKGEPLTTASGGNFVRGEINRKGVVSTVWSNDH